VLKVWIEEVGGEGGPWMVKGMTGDGQAARVLLMDTGARTLEVGRCIGVRAPCWQVKIEEKSWWVGVDWREVG